MSDDPTAAVEALERLVRRLRREVDSDDADVSWLAGRHAHSAVWLLSAGVNEWDRARLDQMMATAVTDPREHRVSTMATIMSEGIERNLPDSQQLAPGPGMSRDKHRAVLMALFEAGRWASAYERHGREPEPQVPSFKRGLAIMLPLLRVEHIDEGELREMARRLDAESSSSFPQYTNAGGVVLSRKWDILADWLNRAIPGLSLDPHSLMRKWRLVKNKPSQP